MANGHGGKRPGAGRPRKPLSEKLLEGNPGKQKLRVLDIKGDAPPPEPPEYIAYYGSKRAGMPDAPDIYRDTVAWLEKTGCLHLVHASLIFDYSIAKAHWYEAERSVTAQGLGYIPEVSDEKPKKVVENPMVEISVKYFKLADMAWSRIWDIVAQNCEQYLDNPHADAMAKLLRYDPGK